MELEGLSLILAILAGFLAGVINTLAGSGSVITISLLVFMGFETSVANGTNRIGVMLQSLVGAKTFLRNGYRLPRNIFWQIVPAFFGAIVGSLIAVSINEHLLNIIVGLLMIMILGLIITKPKEWLKSASEVKNNARSLLSILIFFAIGVYGGFIQAGVGIFLLSALVLFSGYDLATSNLFKLIIVICFTIPALMIFIINKEVVWSVGLLLAFGQSIGAYVAAKFASVNPKANIYVRYLLIVMVLVAIGKFLFFA